MRNFTKKGILITPAIFNAYITNLTYIVDPDFSERLSASFGSFNCFLDGNLYSKTESIGNKKLLPAGVRSDDLFFDIPPDTHSDIGYPLATSLWKNAGMDKEFTEVVKDTETTLDSKLPTIDAKDFTENIIFQSSVELSKSVDWLLRGELFDRSYGYFEAKLK